MNYFILKVYDIMNYVMDVKGVVNSFLLLMYEHGICAPCSFLD